MQHSFQHTLRAGTVVVAMLFSGAVLAEQKQSSSDDQASCENLAAVHLGIDTGQCSSIPTYSEGYSVCMSNAVNKYTSAMRACQEGSGSASLTTQGTGSGNGGGKSGKPKGTKPTGGKPGGATTGGSGTGGGLKNQLPKFRANNGGGGTIF